MWVVAGRGLAHADSWVTGQKSLPGLSDMRGEAPVFIERTSVGLDVHARSVAAAAIDGVTGELVQARLAPSEQAVTAWLAGLPGPVAVVYEAGPTGFGLSRALTSQGLRCVVAAPSKLQRPSGDRVKTDARDAVHLARLLRLDEVTPVAVPTVEQEAARDLVRAREDCRGDLMRPGTGSRSCCCATASSTRAEPPGPAPTTHGSAGRPCRSWHRRPPGWPSTPTTRQC